MRFARELQAPLVVNSAPNGVDGSFSKVRLPRALHERLQRAAELNAFTDIDAALAEIRGGDTESREFANHLHTLLSRYDRAGLLAALEQINHD